MNGPSTTTVYISIGSNTADKRERVTQAISDLEERFPGFVCSDIYESECWRKEGRPYMNAVARFETSSTSEGLEAVFKQLEKEAGRVHDGSGMVTLDIDLVVYGKTVLRERDFYHDFFQKGYRQLTHPANIKIEDYFYELPEEKIALHPLADRDKCKLLVIGTDGQLIDTTFDEIDNYLPQREILIYNNTKVINARLKFVKPTGATIEIFCLEPVLPADYQLNFASAGPVRWKCLIGNSKRWNDGSALRKHLSIDGGEVVLEARRISSVEGESVVEFSWNKADLSFSDIIGNAGQIPIPPYLKRESEQTDNDDYQTVYSLTEGSVAAPTAGLHFTHQLLERLEETGTELRSVTLHVGAGTFRPVKTETIGGHDMHSELIDVDVSLIRQLAENTLPVTAVGTTTLRTLESLYHIGCLIKTGEWNGSLNQWTPYSPGHPDLSRREALTLLADYLKAKGLTRLVTSTQIIIAPGYRFRMIDNLITNFHQPGSTLLLIIAAIVGNDWRAVYNHALRNNYRFLSYGDACLFKLQR